jgi:homoserine kinase type II
MADSHAPGLEMLWETRDPHGALEERFGFADALSAGRWVAATVLEHWGIRIDSCEQIVISDRSALAWLRTPSGQLLAKWSVTPERFPRLSQIARLTHWLDSNGLPVSAPVQSLDGCLQVEVDEISMCLQRVIQGDLLDVEDGDQVTVGGPCYRLARIRWRARASRGSRHPAAAGRRRAGRPASPTARPRRLPLVERLVRRPQDRRGDRLRGGQARPLHRRGCSLGCHARTRFRDWGPVSAGVRAMFLSGYQSVRRLTPVEASWWDALVLWYALALVPPGDDPTGWRPSALCH